MAYSATVLDGWTNLDVGKRCEMSLDVALLLNLNLLTITELKYFKVTCWWPSTEDNSFVGQGCF